MLVSDMMLLPALRDGGTETRWSVISVIVRTVVFSGSMLEWVTGGPRGSHVSEVVSYER